MLDSAIFFPDLGNLSILSREIRDRIYSFALNFNIHPGDEHDDPTCTSANPPPNLSTPWTSLLMTSKRIHTEAKISFFEINEFRILVDNDYTNHQHNRSIVGQVGYTMSLGHNNIYRSRGEAAFFNKIAWDMLPHMQLVHLSVGGRRGLREMDIVPRTHRCVSGPERPNYVPLLKAVEEVCTILKSCHQLHMLRVSVRSIEQRPGSIEKVIEPIRSLRRIKRTKCVAWSMQDDGWVDWSLKGSYGRYMDRIMALPEGVQAPRYIGDEKEPNESDDNIFDTTGAWWMGDGTFAYPEVQYDGLWSDEEDEYEEFMEHMISHHSAHVGPWSDESDDDGGD